MRSGLIIFQCKHLDETVGHLFDDIIGWQSSVKIMGDCADTFSQLERN